MTRIEDLKIILATIDEKLQRSVVYVTNFDATKTSISRLKARQQILDGIRKEFEETQYEYETLREKRIAFENTYCDVMADIMDIIDNYQASSTSQTSALSVQRADNSNLSINLPVLNLTPFSGDYKNWTSFENCFKSLIDENKGLDNKKVKNTRLIVQDHVISLLKLPIINKQSYAALRELLNSIIANIAALKALELPFSSWDALIVPILAEKLDSKQQKD